MSGSGRKHVSKWDLKEDTLPSIDVNSDSHHRDKEVEPVRFNADSNASRRSEEDHQHSRQGRTRSRVSQNNDNSYYSEQDETRQQFSRRSDSRSYSRSRSRSRSPVYRAGRDHAGSYDRHKTRTRDDFNMRGGDQSSSDYGWEDKASRKPRETRYHHHSNDFREEALMVRGARSSDYDDNDFPEERSRREHLHDGVSDPRLRRQRSELTGEKETQIRGGDGEGRFRRSSDIPCKFFAAGNCRNGQHCRFSHHGGADRNQPQDNKNNFYRRDSNYHNRWNDDERLDNGKLSKGTMEMSPDWNYGAHNLKNRMKDEEPGVGSIGQSSKSRVDDQRSSGMYSLYDGDNNKPMLEKPIAESHQNYNIAPVQAFNESHNVLPYQNSQTPGGTQQQVIAPAAAATATATATDFSLNLSNPESGKAYKDNHHSTVEKAFPVQSGVTREQLDQISNISATIAQFLANGQAIPQLSQALLSESSMAVQPNQATHSNNALGMSTDTDEVPPVNPKASEENGDTKTTKEASEEEECKKTGEDVKDAENVVDEDDDDESDEEDKKEMKDPKGMRTFKFALVEVVKELLKPAWKEGKMKKDGYKTIVKKVVEKVTGSMQSGSVPTTQEKIDHYLSASKPKLTKLVQAYISKVKKT